MEKMAQPQTKKTYDGIYNRFVKRPERLLSNAESLGWSLSQEEINYLERISC